jgi:hypothetical protein
MHYSSESNLSEPYPRRQIQLYAKLVGSICSIKYTAQWIKEDIEQKKQCTSRHTSTYIQLGLCFFPSGKGAEESQYWSTWDSRVKLPRPTRKALTDKLIRIQFTNEVKIRRYIGKVRQSLAYQNDYLNLMKHCISFDGSYLFRHQLYIARLSRNPPSTSLLAFVSYARRGLSPTPT